MADRRTQLDRLVTLPPLLPVALQPPPPRRAAPLAAGLLAALLALGAVGAEMPSPEVSALAAAVETTGCEDVRRGEQHQRATNPTAVIHGRLVDVVGAPLPGLHVMTRNALDGSRAQSKTDVEGEFWFGELSEGLYSLEVFRADLSIATRGGIVLYEGEQKRIDLTAKDDSEVMVCEYAIRVPVLHEKFVDSDLIVAASVGKTLIWERDRRTILVATELHIERRMKGAYPRRSLVYLDSVPREGPTGSYGLHSLFPKGRVLAFLKRVREPFPAFPGAEFEPATGWGAVKELDEDALRSYTTRLEALADLRRGAQGEGAFDPRDLAEWLVATAEDPHTRAEALRPLDGAVDALAWNAETQGLTTQNVAANLNGLLARWSGRDLQVEEEAQPLLLGAALTAEHERRLARALREAEGAEFWRLFAMVRRWDAPAALSWLARELRRTGKGVHEWNTDSLDLVARELESPALLALVRTAEGRLVELPLRAAEVGVANREEWREARRVQLLSELRRDFARLLAEEH